MSRGRSESRSRSRPPTGARPSRRRDAGTEVQLGDLPAAWSWFSDAPLAGFGLVRERHWVYAWDDAGCVYLLDAQGRELGRRRTPGKLVAVQAADSGRFLVAASRSGEIWWLDVDGELGPALEVSTVLAPIGLAVDAFGRYAAVSGDDARVMIFGWDGRQYGTAEATRPLPWLAAVPLDDVIIGAAESGYVTAFDFRGRELWRDLGHANCGGLAVSADGAVALLACFERGLMRYDAEGQREGIYRLDEGPRRVALDFAGAQIVCTTVEDSVIALDFAGRVQAKRKLMQRPLGIALDSLARYLVLGYPNGEIRFAPLAAFLEGSDDSSESAPQGRSRGRGRDEPIPISDDDGPGNGSADRPAWASEVVREVEEATYAALATVPEPRGRGNPEMDEFVALFTTRRTLRVYDEAGELRHESERLKGLGTILRPGPDWLLAASDSRLLAYDPRRNESRLSQYVSSEISHLHALGRLGTAALVEGSEYVSSVSLRDEPLWRKRLTARIESLAAQSTGEVAITVMDGTMVVFDADGRQLGVWNPPQREPLELFAFRDGWVSLGRQGRVVRGHDLDGRLLWAVDLPWMPWRCHGFPDALVVASGEGPSLLLDPDGNVTAENREPRENASYVQGPDGAVLRLYRSRNTLHLTTFPGKAVWRRTLGREPGPLLAGPRGVWVFQGATLVYYRYEQGRLGART